jgi:hypothetical protein
LPLRKVVEMEHLLRSEVSASRKGLMIPISELQISGNCIYLLSIWWDPVMWLWSACPTQSLKFWIFSGFTCGEVLMSWRLDGMTFQTWTRNDYDCCCGRFTHRLGCYCKAYYWHSWSKPTR